MSEAKRYKTPLESGLTWKCLDCKQCGGIFDAMVDENSDDDYPELCPECRECKEMNDGYF